MPTFARLNAEDIEPLLLGCIGRAGRQLAVEAAVA